MHQKTTRTPLQRGQESAADAEFINVVLLFAIRDLGGLKSNLDQTVNLRKIRGVFGVVSQLKSKGD
jgi:hypothetical protein